MATDGLEQLLAAWARLGALFNVAPAEQTPDVERLLLATIRAAPGRSRLFSVAAIWLATHGEFVDEGRLARLVREELEADSRPAMGLLLESVQESDPRHQTRFAGAIAACMPAAAEARPLFDIDREGAVCVELARRQASDLSKKWGRWAREINFHNDVVRPADWLTAHNPALAALAART